MMRAKYIFLLLENRSRRLVRKPAVFTFAVLAAGLWLCPLGHAQEAAAGAEAVAASGTLTGYISTSYHFGPDHGGAPFALAPKHRSAWSLDVFGLSLRQPLDDSLLDAGYRIDLWAGPDAAHLDTGVADHTLEIRQAFLDFRLPIADPFEAGEARSIDLRIGAFDSPLGYESLDRNLNPHYTHSWGFTIEPTVHTGLLAMYPGVDAMDRDESNYLLSLGVANTVSPRINGTAENVDRKSLLAGLTYRLPETLGPLGGSVFSVGYVNGRALTGAAAIEHLYLGLGLPLPSDRWRMGLVYDARMLEGAGNDDSVFGVYLGRRLNDQLWLNLRGEIFRDGDRLFSAESSSEQTDGHGITATLDYQLWENVISRLEYRWDHYDSPVNGRHNSQALHLNLIYEF